MQEAEITNLKISMKGIQKDIAYIKQSQERIEKKVDNFINEASDKFADKSIETNFNQFKKDATKIYACKTTEKIVYGMVWLLLTGIVLEILHLVLK